MRIGAALALAAILAGVSLPGALGRPRSSAPPPQPSGPLRLDLRHTGGRPSSFLRLFDFSAMYRSLPPDAIRAIDRPIFETPAQARALLPPSSLVIGLARGDEAHAYPVDLLSLHEVVNDVVGGEPIAITWCPLCYTALGFDRRVGGRVLTFGISGYLYHANQILFDRETGSLWSQLLGGAVTGRMRGQALRTVPLVQETWAAWLAEHPKTVVLSIKRDPLAENFTNPRSYTTARGLEESDMPYGAYFSKINTYRPRVVRGVRDSSLVLGLFLRGHAKAYPEATLERRRAIDDVVAGEPVLIAYDDDAQAASAYSRRVRTRALTFRLEGGRLVDRETGSRWSPTSGRALAGPLSGAQLARLPATFSFWFAWRAFHPHTAIGR